MTIENRDGETYNSRVLSACPYCGVEFGERYSPRHHLPCDGVPETEGFEE